LVTNEFGLELLFRPTVLFKYTN